MIAKQRAIKLLLCLSTLLCMAGLIVGSVSAQEAQVAPFVPPTALSFAVDGTKTNNQESLLDIQIDGIQRAIALQEERTGDRVKELEDLIAVQRDTINDLRVDLKSIADKPLTNGTTFEIWSGVALAVAAIVLTGVAIMVGIGSFWGFREIKDSSNRAANETAEKVVKNLVPLVVAENTEEELYRLIDNGRLDSVVDEIMQKIIYKDVAFEDDLPSE